jgi:predicted amidophosphoribosyltransferase
MPLHPRRLAERGFNQALEIARSVARHLGRPIEPRGVLRVKDTLPQTKLPYEERAKNVRGAFLCKLDLSGASVAVVDDVMTTGATLNELARALKRAGATRVENLVIARTVKR